MILRSMGKNMRMDVDLDVVMTGEEIKQLFLNMPSLKDININRIINKLLKGRVSALPF